MKCYRRSDQKPALHFEINYLWKILKNCENKRAPV